MGVNNPMLIPKEMQDMSQWAVYKAYWQPDKGKKGKVVLNVADGHWAKSNDPTTWTTFDRVIAYTRNPGTKVAGVAFALTKASNITCIDLDHCYDSNGKPNSLAKKMLQLLPDTYAERSVSGNGLHIFVRGDLTNGGEYANRTMTEHGEIEVYSNNRFISMTGCSVNGITTLAEPTAEVKGQVQSMLRRVKRSTIVPNHFTEHAGDAKVVARILKSKTRAEYESLARGENLTGDLSRNDWRMAKILGFFSCGDVQQTARIMRSTGINRPDKPDIYYERTAQKAIESLPTVYNKSFRSAKARENKQKQGKARGLER